MARGPEVTTGMCEEQNIQEQTRNDSLVCHFVTALVLRNDGMRSTHRCSSVGLTAKPLCHAATSPQLPVPAAAVLVGVAPTVFEVAVVLGIGQVFPRTAVIHGQAASGNYPTSTDISSSLSRAAVSK